MARSVFILPHAETRRRGELLIWLLRASASPRENDVLLNRQIIRAGSAGAGVAHALADGGEFGSEVVFDEEHVGAVDEEVGAHLEETGLLLGVAPEMDAGTPTGGTGFVKDGLHGGKKFRRFVLLGHAEVAGKVVRADEQGIHFGRGQPIDVRRLHHRMPAEVANPIILIVDGDHEDVGFFVCRVKREGQGQPNQ